MPVCAAIWACERSGTGPSLSYGHRVGLAVINSVQGPATFPADLVGHSALGEALGQQQSHPAMAPWVSTMQRTDWDAWVLGLVSCHAVGAPCVAVMRHHHVMSPEGVAVAAVESR